MLKLFKAVEDEFSTDIAVLVIQIKTIQRTMKWSKLTEERVIKKFTKIAGHLANEDRMLVINIYKCTYDWDICNSMNGIGGCVKKSFKELISKLETGELI